MALKMQKKLFSHRMNNLSGTSANHPRKQAKNIQKKVREMKKS